MSFKTTDQSPGYTNFKRIAYALQENLGVYRTDCKNNRLQALVSDPPLGYREVECAYDAGQERLHFIMRFPAPLGLSKPQSTLFYRLQVQLNSMWHLSFDAETAQYLLRTCALIPGWAPADTIITTVTRELTTILQDTTFKQFMNMKGETHHATT